MDYVPCIGLSSVRISRIAFGANHMKKIHWNFDRPSLFLSFIFALFKRRNDDRQEKNKNASKPNKMHKWSVTVPASGDDESDASSLPSPSMAFAPTPRTTKTRKLHKLFRHKSSATEHIEVLDEQRWDHSMFRLGSAQDRFYVFGGSNGDGKQKFNDVIEFVNVRENDSDQWQCRSIQTFGCGGYSSASSIPCERDSHTTAVFKNPNTRQEEVCLFGGVNAENQCLDDMWILNCSSWEWRPVSVKAENGPCARSHHTAVIVEGSDDQQDQAPTMWIFGGFDGNRSLNDLWYCDLETMSFFEMTPLSLKSSRIQTLFNFRLSVSPSTPSSKESKESYQSVPPPRHDHTATVVRLPLAAGAGATPITSTPFSSTLGNLSRAFDGEQLTSPKRWSTEKQYISEGLHMIVCFGHSINGGSSTSINTLKKLYTAGRNYLDDIWCFSFSSMTWIDVTASMKGKLPSARAGHTASNIGRGCIFVFGGVGSLTSFKKDAFVIDLTQSRVEEVPRVKSSHRITGHKTTKQGTQQLEWPQARKGHVQWFNPVLESIIVHGGGNSKKGEQYNNICRFDCGPLVKVLRIGSKNANDSTTDLSSPVNSSRTHRKRRHSRRSVDIKSKMTRIESLTEKISRAVHDVDLLIQRAEQYCQLGSYQNAYNDYTSAAKIIRHEEAKSNSHVAMLSVNMSRALCLYKLEKFKEAHSLIHRYLTDDDVDTSQNETISESMRGFLISAKCLAAMGQNSQAIEDCNAAIRLYSNGSNRSRKTLLEQVCKTYRVKIKRYIHLRTFDLAESSIETLKLLVDEQKSKSKRELLLQDLDQLEHLLNVRRKNNSAALECVQQARELIENANQNDEEQLSDSEEVVRSQDAANQVLEILERALNHDAQCEDALSMMMDILYQKQQFKQATRTAKALITFNPDNTQAYCVAGRSLIARRKLTQAIEFLSRAEDTASEEELESIQAIHSNAKNMRESYEEALMHAIKAEELEIQNLLDEALEQYDLALRQDPRNIHYVAGRANLLSRMNRTHEAIDAGYLAIELDPQSHLGYLTVGATLISAHCLAQAVDIIEDGLEYTSNHESLQQQHRVANDRIQRSEQANNLLHSALDDLAELITGEDPLLTFDVLQPDCAEFSQEKRESLESILDALNQSISLFDIDVNAYVARAKCKYLLRRFVSSVADCLHVLETIATQRNTDEKGEQIDDIDEAAAATLRQTEQQIVEDVISIAAKAHASTGQFGHVDMLIKTQTATHKSLLSNEQLSRLKTLQKTIDNDRKSRGKAMRKYEKGRKHAAHGRYNDAIKQFTMALALQSVDDLNQSTLSKILFERADAYYHVNMPDLCMRDCQEAMVPTPLPHHIVLHAICLSKLGRLEESVRSLSSALNTTPFNSPLNDTWLSLKYRLYTSRGKALFKHGEKYMQKYEFEEAIERMAEVIAMDPRHSPAYLVRGRCFYNTNRLIRALRDVEKCIELEDTESPMVVEAHYIRGCILVKRRCIDEAALAFMTAMELDSNCAKAQNRMEELEELMYRGNQSEQLYNQARDMIEQISNSSMDVDTFALYRARNLLTKAILLDPANARFYAKRSLVSLDLMMPSKALDDADIAVTLDPVEAGGLIAKTLALMEMSRYQEALETLSEAEEVEGDSQDLQAIRADLIERESRSRKALEFHSSGMELLNKVRSLIDTGEMDKRDENSKLSSTTGAKLDKALKYLTQASNYEPLNFQYQRNYISCLLLYTDQDHWEEALSATRAMVRLHPTRVEVYELLTSLCIENDDFFTALFSVCQGIDACKREDESNAFHALCLPLLKLLGRIVKTGMESNSFSELENMNTTSISWDDPSSIDQFQDIAERSCAPETISLDDVISSFSSNNERASGRNCDTFQTIFIGTKTKQRALYSDTPESSRTTSLLGGLELDERRKMTAFEFALQAFFVTDRKNDINRLCKLLTVDEMTKVQFYAPIRERGLLQVMTDICSTRFKAVQDDDMRFHDTEEQISQLLTAHMPNPISVGELVLPSENEKTVWKTQLRALVDQMLNACMNNSSDGYNNDNIANAISLLEHVAIVRGFGKLYPIFLLLEISAFNVRNSASYVHATYTIMLTLVQRLLEFGMDDEELNQADHVLQLRRWQLEDDEAISFAKSCQHVSDFSDYILNNHFASTSLGMDMLIQTCLKIVKLLHVTQTCLLDGSCTATSPTEDHLVSGPLFATTKGFREWLQERIETSVAIVYSLMKLAFLQGANGNDQCAEPAASGLSPTQLIYLANLIKRYMNIYESRFEPLFTPDVQVMQTIARKFFDMYWLEIKNCLLKRISHSCDVTLISNAHSVDIPEGTFLLPHSVKQLFQHLTEYAGSILRPFKVFSLVEPFIICWLNQYQHKMISWAMRSNELDAEAEWDTTGKALHTSSVVDVFLSINQGLETIYQNFEFLSEASAMEQHDRGDHFFSAFSLIYFTYMDIVRKVVVEYVSDLSRRLSEHACQLKILHVQQGPVGDQLSFKPEKQLLKAMCLMINNAYMSCNNLDTFIQDVRQQLERVDLPVWEGYSDHIRMAKKDLQDIVNRMVRILQQVSIRPLTIRFSESMKHLLSSPWPEKQGQSLSTKRQPSPQQQRSGLISKLFKHKRARDRDEVSNCDDNIQASTDMALTTLLDGFDRLLSIFNKTLHEDGNIFQQVLRYTFDQLMLDMKEVIVPPVDTSYPHLLEEHTNFLCDNIMPHISDYFMASGQGVREKHLRQEMSLLVFLLSCHHMPAFELVEKYNISKTAVEKRKKGRQRSPTESNNNDEDDDDDDDESVGENPFSVPDRHNGRDFSHVLDPVLVRNYTLAFLHRKIQQNDETSMRIINAETSRMEIERGRLDNEVRMLSRSAGEIQDEYRRMKTEVEQMQVECNESKQYNTYLKQLRRLGYERKMNRKHNAETKKRIMESNLAIAKIETEISATNDFYKREQSYLEDWRPDFLEQITSEGQGREERGVVDARDEQDMEHQQKQKHMQISVTTSEASLSDCATSTTESTTSSSTDRRSISSTVSRDNRKRLSRILQPFSNGLHALFTKNSLTDQEHQSEAERTRFVQQIQQMSFPPSDTLRLKFDLEDGSRLLSSFFCREASSSLPGQVHVIFEPNLICFNTTIASGGTNSKFVIPFDDIVQVSTVDKATLRDGIKISTGSARSYVFCGIEDRDAMLDELLKLVMAICPDKQLEAKTTDRGTRVVVLRPLQDPKFKAPKKSNGNHHRHRHHQNNHSRMRKKMSSLMFHRRPNK